MKKKFITILILLLFPLEILAYSNKLIIGGDAIGIEIYSKGIYVVGFYPVNNKDIGKEAGFQIGDLIKSINNKEITSINSINNIINDEDNYSFHIERNNKELDINLPVKKEDNIYKTGLYVKNQINGIGTISYIDPESKIYGALGHDIIENSSNKTFLIKEGNIYKAEVTSIKKSERKNIGEKNANINKDEEIGNILLNESSGIYGKYYKDLDNLKTLEVGKKEEIKKDEAYIRTVIDKDKINLYKIDIINIEENQENKNIFFEITDENLLNKTGGIVQGMSGSPIIQNNKIIGVVNYVVVDEAKYGYGIFIETMLKESDKIS